MLPLFATLVGSLAESRVIRVVLLSDALGSSTVVERLILNHHLVVLKRFVPNLWGTHLVGVVLHNGC